PSVRSLCSMYRPANPAPTTTTSGALPRSTGRADIAGRAALLERLVSEAIDAMGHLPVGAILHRQRRREHWVCPGRKIAPTTRAIIASFAPDGMSHLPRISGRSAFLQLLVDEGVTHLFGNPATTELPLM